MCHKLGIALAVLATSVVAGCGGTENESASKEVVLVTHDSFAISKELKAAFEAESGLQLKILQGGDAGEALNRALLTKGNPQGDVLFGVDNNLLSRALGEKLFEPYEARDLDRVERTYTVDPENRVTPIDHGDVCLNVDQAWFETHGVAPPRTLADLTDRRYRKLLVVENPATSTPGLAFMLATIARFGEHGWRGYWKKLRDNGLLVVDGWEEAYTARFSGAAGSNGKRPIVVSYATSPAAEASTGAVEETCFRQVELAGVLAGARNTDGAHALIDFMLSARFQAALPSSMYVLPVRADTPLPPAFQRKAVSPTNPLDLPAAEIGANRDRWIDEWTQTVLR